MRKVHTWTLAYLAAAVTGGLLVLGPGVACNNSIDAPAPAATTTPTTQIGALPLERFHYVAAVTLHEQQGGNNIAISTEGDYQAPNRHAFTYTVAFGQTTVKKSAVVIGDSAWLRTGEDPWRRVAPNDPELTAMLSTAFSAIRPDFLGGEPFEQVRANVRRLPATQEDVNGVTAEHYQVGAPGNDYFSTFLADAQLLTNVNDMHWDLWLARDGEWPVRLLASATITADMTVLNDLSLHPPTAWQLTVDVSRPNDPTLAVAAPTE